MKISIIAMGKARAGAESQLVEQYLRQCGWQVNITELQIKKPLQGEALKKAEAELLLGAMQDMDACIALDERGKHLSSMEFARTMERWQDIGQHRIAIVIGGADGLHESVRAQARLLLSFGRLTWPHMLVRSMLAEQLYRAWSILQGHPYHRE